MRNFASLRSLAALRETGLQAMFLGRRNLQSGVTLEEGNHGRQSFEWDLVAPG